MVNYYNRDLKPKLYLAGPHGFSEITRLGMKDLIEILEQHFSILNPFIHEINQPHGFRIAEIMNELVSTRDELSFKNKRDELIRINMQLGENNEYLIKKSDLVLACLDGPDVDSGTAAEIGYAYALKKGVWGYRNDFRLAGDNYGSTINLQVEYFIKASGGKIFHSMKEIKESISHMKSNLN